MKTRMLALLTMLLMAVLPSIAQDQDALKEVSFNGYSFSYPEALAPNLRISSYAGDPLDEPPPGEQTWHEPRYTEFELYDTNGRRSWATIHLAQIADLVGYPEAQVVAELQTLLDTRPDLKTYESSTSDDLTNRFPMPHRGVPPQTVIARTRYVETDTFIGIGYLAVYVQDTFPFNSDFLDYNFIGISKDESTYIWLNVHVRTDLFPSFMDAKSDAASQEFYTDNDAYLLRSIERIKAAPDTAFTPTSDELDTLFASIRIGQDE